MTEAPRPGPGTAEALPAPDDGRGLVLPATGTGERAVRRRRRSRNRQLRRAGFAATLAVLALAIPLLGYVGFRAVLTSKDGRVIDPVLDPHELNYEAVVEPTPVALVAHVSAAGADAEDPDGGPDALDDVPAPALVGLTVLALGPGDRGGGVLVVPVGTLTDDTTRFGFEDLAGAYLVGGLDGVRQATANLLGTSITEAVTVDDDRWSELVAPVAPVELANPDEVVVVDGDGAAEAVFAAGAIKLGPADVGRFLAIRSPGESAVAPLVRDQLFWSAWLDQVEATDDPGAAVPGEGGRGLARFVRGLGAAERVIETLPVRAISSSSEFVAIAPDLRALVARLVPFPTAANPGDRVRLRVLDGTGTDGATELAARRLVPNGAEIVVVGNADRFDYEVTEVRYPEGSEERAREVLDGLDVGVPAPQRSGNDTVDITVVVGRDLLESGPGAADTGAAGTGAAGTDTIQAGGGAGTDEEEQDTD